MKKRFVFVLACLIVSLSLFATIVAAQSGDKAAPPQTDRIILDVDNAAAPPASYSNPLTNLFSHSGILGTSSVTPLAPTGPVSLVLDDGIAEDAIGLQAGGQFIWLNRFTPAAAAYPFVLDQIQVLFSSATGINVGETVDLYVYEDADGNPANGAVFVGSSVGVTVQALDSFSTYPVNMVLNGPGGDVLIAVVNRTAGTASGTFVAAIDQTATQGRSWVGLYAGNPANPPVLPAPTFAVVDTLGFPGNWMVRGAGSPYAPPAIDVALTVSTDGSCGTSNSITADYGATITNCYQVENTGNVTLTHHTVDDSNLGTVAGPGQAYNLAPGATFSFTTDYTLDTVSVTSVMTWTAFVSGTQVTASGTATATVTGQPTDVSLSTFAGQSGSPLVFVAAALALIFGVALMARRRLS